jgi:hypothetical protein
MKVQNYSRRRDRTKERGNFMKCWLCFKESATVRPFTWSPETQRLWEEKFPGLIPDRTTDKFGECDECAALSRAERKELAKKVVDQHLEEIRQNEKARRESEKSN